MVGLIPNTRRCTERLELEYPPTNNSSCNCSGSNSIHDPERMLLLTDEIFDAKDKTPKMNQRSMKDLYMKSVSNANRE